MKKAAKKKTVGKKTTASKETTTKKATKTTTGKKKATTAKKATKVAAEKTSSSGTSAGRTRRARRTVAKATGNKSKKQPETRTKTDKARKEPEKLTPAQRREFRDMLITMSDQLRNQITALRDDSLKRADEVNHAEDGTDAFERQFALKLASTEHESVVEIDDALRRIRDRTYGICENCERLIEYPRLKALPFVRLCISCQSEEERKHGPYRQASVRRGLV